jgi:hypothetical protein
MPTLHPVEERSRIAQVNAGKRAAARFGDRQNYSRPSAWLRTRTSQDQAQALFNQRGQGLASLVRLALGLVEQVFIEPDCGSHMSRHISKTLICQGFC